MKLYLAEKPSLGRAIADALPKPHKKQQGFIEVGNGDVVSWCIGHILAQADPEDYDVELKKWRMETLRLLASHPAATVIAKASDLNRTVRQPVGLFTKLARWLNTVGSVTLLCAPNNGAATLGPS